MQALNDTKQRTLETFKNQRGMVLILINPEQDRRLIQVLPNGTHINSSAIAINIIASLVFQV